MDRPLPSRFKPLSRLRLNRNHPLARNLLDCYVFSPQNGMGFISLGDQRSHATLAAPSSGVVAAGNWAAAPEPSIQIPLDNTKGDTWWNIPDYGVNYGAGDMSIFCRFIPQTFSNANNALFRKEASAGGIEYAVFFSATGAQNTSIIGNVADPVAYTNSFTAGVITDYCVTRAIGGPQAIYYQNGAQFGSATSNVNGTTGSGASSAMMLGRSLQNAGQGIGAQYMCFYIWSRVLSAAEVQQLHFDPYGFLVPVAEPTFLTAAAAAAPSAAVYGNPFICGAGVMTSIPGNPPS